MEDRLGFFFQIFKKLKNLKKNRFGPSDSNRRFRTWNQEPDQNSLEPETRPTSLRTTQIGRFNPIQAISFALILVIKDFSLGYDSSREGWPWRWQVSGGMEFSRMLRWDGLSRFWVPVGFSVVDIRDGRNDICWCNSVPPITTTCVKPLLTFYAYASVRKRSEGQLLHLLSQFASLSCAVILLHLCKLRKNRTIACSDCGQLMLPLSFC